MADLASPCCSPSEGNEIDRAKQEGSSITVRNAGKAV